MRRTNRRTRRKIFAPVVPLGIGMALVLTACGSTATPSSAARKTQPSNRSTSANSTTTTTIAPVSINHGNVAATMWDGITGGNEASFVSWLKTNPSPLKLTADELPWSVIYSKLPTAFTGGQPPNLLMLHPYDLLTYAEHGALVPLNKMVNSIEPGSVLNSSAWKANSYHGTQFAAPVGMWDQLWYYNKKMWAKIGYPQGPPTNNPTALLAALKKLTVVRNGKTVQWGFATSDTNLHRFYATLMLQMGAHFITPTSVDFTSSASKKVVAYMKNLVQTAKVEPSPAGLQPDVLFEENKVGLYLDGEWHIPEFEAYNKSASSGHRLSWGITTSPVVMVPGGKPVTLEGGPALAIAKATGDKSKGELKAEEAFISWAVKDEGTWCANGGLLPDNPSSTALATLKSANASQYDATVFLQYGHALPTNPHWDNLNSEVWTPMLEKAMETSARVSSVVSAAQSQLTGIGVS